jgi:putative thioredoxin
MSIPSPFILETSEESFARDVIDRSQDLLVVVDFWAEWCGPCRTLGPILEKLAVEYGGKFLLAKVDIERVPGIAAEFRVRSIPAVFAVRDGKIVDSFVGALSESAVRKFLDRLIPTPAEDRVAEAKALESADPAAAEARYRDALTIAPNDPKGTTGLARLLWTAGRFDEARSLLAGLESRGLLGAEGGRLKAELALRGPTGEWGSVENARAAVASRPDDRNLKLKLAGALAAAGHHEEALDIALELVERDRKGVGEEARRLMLNVFQLLPADSGLLSDFRRRLAAALF